MQEQESYKRQAALRAVEYVQSGMVVGLGSGSTASYALERLAEKLAAGELTEVLGVPTASYIEAQARRLEIGLTTLGEHPLVDLTIDGADEVDPELNLIKGGGGALLREKIVAQASRMEIIAVDHSKLSDRLGNRTPLPVEVLPFGWQAQERYLSSLGAAVRLRMEATGEPYSTDQGNWILDCDFGPISDPAVLAGLLEKRAGIVEHGLFLGLAGLVIVAGPEGIRELKRG